MDKTWKLSRGSMAELHKALLTNEDEEAAAATKSATESEEARDETADARATTGAAS